MTIIDVGNVEGHLSLVGQRVSYVACPLAKPYNTCSKHMRQF
jgi:hypothetical protein